MQRERERRIGGDDSGARGGRGGLWRWFWMSDRQIVWHHLAEHSSQVFRLPVHVISGEEQRCAGGVVEITARSKLARRKADYGLATSRLE